MLNRLFNVMTLLSAAACVVFALAAARIQLFLGDDLYRARPNTLYSVHRPTIYDLELLWCPTFATAVLPAAWLVTQLMKYRRRRMRLRSGACLKCGYDLRASKDRCPECGRSIPATQNQPSAPPPKSA